jgi:hypothetical protein
MSRRPAHPRKEIEQAVRDAEALGWRWRKGGGHAWARLLCPAHTRDGCQISIWSTPRNPEAHARDIRRLVAKCRHDP